MNLTRTGGLAVAAAAGLAMIAAGLAPAAAAHVTSGASAAPAVTHYKGTTGVAHLVPRSARHATGATRMLWRGNRLSGHAFSPTERVPRAPATAASGAAAITATTLSNFNGTSSRDSQFTNYNLEFEPPDQGLCEANGFVLEPVNSAYRIFSTSGRTIRGPFNINDLYNVGGKEFTSDPRCWYDPATTTWFSTIVFLNDTGTQGVLLIAVRHAKDPLGLWNEYSIDATDPGGLGCPCFGDQPRIGIDQQNLYVTADEFSIQGPQFNGPELWVIDKAGLVAGNPTVNFAHFGHLTPVPGQTTLAPQPALTTARPPAEFMLGQLDFRNQGDNRISVWAITHRAAVVSGGVPILSSVVIRSEQYASPPPVPQKGSPSTLNQGDDRMQQTAFAGNTVWGELGTAITPAGDSAVRAGAAWFQVKPRLAGGMVVGARMVRQGYVAARGRYLIYPSLWPDAAGNAAMGLSESSSTMFPSTAYAKLGAGASNFGPVFTSATGFGPYFKKSTRWGDYSFAVPGAGDTAWLANEYIPPKSSQTTDGAQNWGTRVVQVPLR